MTTGRDLVGAARRYVGVPYLYGGKDGAGLDCSGLITLALADLGVPFVHGSSAQIDACEPIGVEEGWATPGALLWREGHDAISTGSGTVEAVQPAVSELGRSDTYAGAPRFTRAGLIPGIDYSQEATMAAPSAGERVKSATAAVGKGASFAGMCEKFTRGHFGFPARYPSAKLAYEASARDGKITKSFDAPPGVPVFWDILTGKNAKYDHVAISVGGGYCVSTSAGPGGTVAKVRIADLTRRWGMRYHGWADVYHGERVYDWPVKDTTPAPAPTPEPKPEPKRKAPTMLVVKWGRSKWRLITGDRMVAISEADAGRLTGAGLPTVALDNATVENMQRTLIFEGE